MPPFKVDRDTYNALQLAQGAINFARLAVPYGAANQIADFKRTRTGGISTGAQLPRLQACRNSYAQLLALPHAPLGPLGLDDKNYATGIVTGITLYYGAGNCGEHANLTYSFIAQFGYPGITVYQCSSTIMDHAFTLIRWNNPDLTVVCDAWPSVRPQACLWSHFFANPAFANKAQPGFKILAQHSITDQNMGEMDVVGLAYRAINPTFIAGLQRQSLIRGYTQDVIKGFLESRTNGLYNHEYTTAAAYQPYQEYSYGTELLSRALTSVERWTARVQPIIAEVGLHPQMLNPQLRYTSMSGV